MPKTIYSEKYKRVLELLRQARKEAGLTQIEVADGLGKPQSFVAKCESGERRIDIVELSEFAHLYQKSIEYFLEE
jgi:transcriptional regulator with XRE-family HTH domain